MELVQKRRHLLLLSEEDLDQLFLAKCRLMNDLGKQFGQLVELKIEAVYFRLITKTSRCLRALHRLQQL